MAVVKDTSRAGGPHMMCHRLQTDEAIKTAYSSTTSHINLQQHLRTVFVPANAQLARN